jgi:hypothetical protein
MGRPSKYQPAFAEQALKLCRLGATDKELADFFQVEEQTINNWKQAHPEFLESLKQGKGLADAEVADKLFKRATGYEHKAVKITASPDGREHLTEYVERYPPDTTAAIFWLKNRRPDVWRDKTDVNHSGTVGIKRATELTDDELASIAAGGGAGANAAKGRPPVTH